MDGNIAHSLEGKLRTDDVKLKELSPFHKMLLSESVRKGLQHAGFTFPTILQAAAIPIGTSGFDLLVQSKSGTGKTVIFCTVILEQYAKDISAPQSLILTPTREVAIQIETVLNEIGRFCKDFCAVSVIGGTDVAEDRKRLQKAKAIVGTPGRLKHLMKNNVLNTKFIKLLVVDEADKMFSDDFRKDLLNIQKDLPSKRQTIACSATFCDGQDRELAKTMLKPLLISTETNTMLLLGIKQFVYELPEQKTSIMEMQLKLRALREIFDRFSFKQCILFAGSQSRADSYRSYLQKDGWPCDLISGAQNQTTRLEVFNNFRTFKTRILVATDLMSRGVDSEYVNLVINLELPIDVVTYLHRVGRAGRFGSHGIAISFVASAKDNTNFSKLVSHEDNGMKVLRFPKADAVIDESEIWDFENYEKDCDKYGLFGKNQVVPLATLKNGLLANEANNKENQQENTYNSNSSIDTKTFQVDSKESAFNAHLSLEVEHILPPLQRLTHESRESSTQQLPSSNTIDDASSITVDADSLCSSQQDISRRESLLQLLLDSPTLEKNVGVQINENEIQQDINRIESIPIIQTNDKIGKNVFDNYLKYIDKNMLKSNNNEGAASTTETESANYNKNNALHSTANRITKYDDLLDEIANDNGSSVSQSEADNNNDKGTFIVSLPTPSTDDDSIAPCRNTSLLFPQCDSTSASLIETKHFPSPTNLINLIPTNVATTAGIPLELKTHISNLHDSEDEENQPRQLPNLNVDTDSEDVASSSNESGSHANGQQLLGAEGNVAAGGGGGSSGFDEGTTSCSSGIDTSEAECDENNSYETSSEENDAVNDAETDADTTYSEEDESADGSEKDVSKDTKSIGDESEQETSDEERDEVNNQPATMSEFWKSMYATQTGAVQNYVRWVNHATFQNRLV